MVGGANRSDIKILDPTLDVVSRAGLFGDIGRLHLDGGYDYPVVRRRLHSLGIDDHVIRERGTKMPGTKQPPNLGLRWIVKAATSWWSNYGQLRRKTDRRKRHRHATICLATNILIIGRPIDHRNKQTSN